MYCACALYVQNVQRGAKSPWKLNNTSSQQKKNKIITISPSAERYCSAQLSHFRDAAGVSWGVSTRVSGLEKLTHTVQYNMTVSIRRSSLISSHAMHLALRGNRYTFCVTQNFHLTHACQWALDGKIEITWILTSHLQTSPLSPLITQESCVAASRHCRLPLPRRVCELLLNKKGIVDQNVWCRKRRARSFVE